MTPHRFDLCQACPSCVCFYCRSAIELAAMTVVAHCLSNFAVAMIVGRPRGEVLARNPGECHPMLPENLVVFLKLSMVWSIRICWRDRAANYL